MADFIVLFMEEKKIVVTLWERHTFRDTCHYISSVEPSFHGVKLTSLNNFSELSTTDAFVMGLTALSLKILLQEE